MTDPDAVRALLMTAADGMGEVSPPPVEQLLRRRRHRSGVRTAAAAVAVAALVVSIAVVLTRGPDRDRGTPVTRRPTDSDTVGPGVAQLERYRWRPLPPAPIAPRDDATADWTGRKMIVWGGQSGDRAFTDGAAYDPASRAWTKLPPSPLQPLGETTGIWVDGSFVVWSGDDGARYDVANRRWSMLPAPAGISSQQTAELVAVDGRAILVHAPSSPRGTVVHADAYDPAGNRWQQLPDLALPADHAVGQTVALGVGHTLYVWAQWAHTVGTGPGESETSFGVDTYRFDIEGRRWQPAAVQPDRSRSAQGALAADRSIYLPQNQPWFGGFGGPIDLRNYGVLVSPSTGVRRSSPQAGLASVGTDLSFWTGGAILLLNPSAEASGRDGTRPGDTFAWQPGARRWRRLASAPMGRGSSPAAVWAGDRLLVWGRGGFEFAPPGG